MIVMQRENMNFSIVSAIRLTDVLNINRVRMVGLMCYAFRMHRSGSPKNSHLRKGFYTTQQYYHRHQESNAKLYYNDKATSDRFKTRHFQALFITQLKYCLIYWVSLRQTDMVNLNLIICSAKSTDHGPGRKLITCIIKSVNGVLGSVTRTRNSDYTPDNSY